MKARRKERSGLLPWAKELSFTLIRDRAYQRLLKQELRQQTYVVQSLGETDRKRPPYTVAQGQRNMDSKATMGQRVKCRATGVFTELRAQRPPSRARAPENTTNT